MKKKYHSLDNLAKPYFVWIGALALLPILIMFILMFMTTEGISMEDATFSLDTFSVLTEISTVVAFWNSVFYSVIATMICIVLGYIVAYTIFRSNFRNKFIVLVIMILPMWANILLRVIALGNIMEENNIIVSILGNLGITVSGLAINGSAIAVIIGLVFTYLPFTILPIYIALEKIDSSLEEAALDLGLTETKKFWKVVFPLSFKGVVTGSIMVFLPCMSGFAIPEILGKGNIILIGNIIEDNFNNMNYNVGAMLAIIILVVILGSLFIVNKVDKEGETLV